MKTRINVALLLRVADQIMKTPEQFNMRDWDCGTTACIAGWASRLGGGKTYMPLNAKFHPARDLLGLDILQNAELFSEENWPDKFIPVKGDAPAQRASKAVRRIHAFLDDYAPGWRYAKEFAK